MSGPYRQWLTDKELEQRGVWLEYDDYRIRIARAGGANKPFLRAAEEFRRKHKHELRWDLMKTEEQNEEAIKIYARTIVLDWEGVVDQHGEPMPLTYENIVKLFTDLPDLFINVQERATDLALWKAYLDEQAAGNL